MNAHRILQFLATASMPQIKSGVHSNAALTAQPTEMQRKIDYKAQSITTQLKHKRLGESFSALSLFVPLVLAWAFLLFTSSRAQALAINDRVQATGALNVRDLPASTTILATKSAGNKGFITDGPVTATFQGTSYIWWKVLWDDDVWGWSIANTLQTIPLWYLDVYSSNPNSGVSVTASPVDVFGYSSITTSDYFGFDNNVSVTLTAPATAGGNSFLQWNRNGSFYSSSRTTTVTMNADYSFTAVYACLLPGFPNSPNPANGATVTSQPTILDWANASGATSYDVYLDGTFRANVTSSQWTVNQTLSATTHNWYVVAKNACGQSPGPSPVWSFTISPSSGTISVRVDSSSGSPLAASEMNVVSLRNAGGEVSRITSPVSNPINFASITYGSYFLRVYCWDMLAAETVNFTHNISTSSFSVQTNPKRPLNVTVFYNDGDTRLPGATVYLDSWNGEFGFWTQRANTTADSSGNAAFNAWPTTLDTEGEQYRLRVSYGGNQVGSINPVVVWNLSTGSGYSVTTTVAAPLPPTGFGGIVTDSLSGNPIQGATVNWGSYSTTTAANGSYSINNISCGTATLSVSKIGYTGSSQSYTPTCNATSLRNVQLSPNITAFAGVVTDSLTGNSISGVTVSWNGITTTTAANGSYSLSGLPCATATLTVSRSDYLTYSQSHTPACNASSVKNILLSQIDPDDQISEATSLGNMTQTIEGINSIVYPTDVDIYSFAVVAGQRISFDIDLPSGSTFNSYIRLFNSSGTQLASNDNAAGRGETSSGAESYLEHTFASSGTYYIGVSGSGNSSYDPVVGNGDANGSTGDYRLFVSPGITGAIPPPSANFVFSQIVDIQRFAAQGAFPGPISTTPGQQTWIVIHGRNSSRYDTGVNSTAGGNIPRLAQAIANQRPGDQVLTLDWSGAADDSNLSFTEEDWIQPVAQWAAAALTSYGLTGSSLNLVGHSWGGNMTDEIAERIAGGGVNTIVVLDPARNGLGSYDPDDFLQIDLRAHSIFSWAFHTSLAGSPRTPTSAHEAFIVNTGLNQEEGVEGNRAAHSAAVNFFSFLLENSATGIGPLFNLERLTSHRFGPWLHNQVTTIPFCLPFGIDCEDLVGNYEGIITTVANIANPQPLGLYYIPIPAEISVAGNGISIADGATATSTLDGTDFGTILQGQTGISRTFTVRNAGGSTLTLGSISVPPGFILDDGLTFELTQGEVDTFTVRLNTTSAGIKSGQISITNSDSDETPFNFSISGMVTPLPIVATPTISPNGGSYSGSVQVTLDCSTSQALIYYTINGSEPTTGSTSYEGPFTLTSSVIVKAKAFRSGYGDSATATSSFTITPTPTRIISLSGNLTFGNLLTNTTATRTLMISNGGNSTLNVSSISYPAGFSGAWSGNILAGGFQNVTVTFAPTVATNYGGTATVNGDGSGVNNITASGTGTISSPQTGSLQVSLAPSEAVSAGAQWRVDGGAWQASGATISGLSLGNHPVTFNTVTDWMSPGIQSATITANQTTIAAGTYVAIPQQTNQLTEIVLSNGLFSFVLNGPVGSNYVIQVSSNVVNWLPLSTHIIPASGWVLITDPSMTNHSRRFYRAVPQALLPPRITSVGHIDNGGLARSVIVAGSYAYLANEDDGLRVYDITVPANPIPIGWTNNGSSAWAVAVAGNFAYLANFDDGLRVYNIANPANPVNTSQIDNGGQARGVAVAGSLAYLANYNDGLRIYTITNPATPIYVGRTNNGGLALGVAVAGNFAYLANDADGLRVYNISNPVNPVNVGHTNNNGTAKNITVSGNVAYLANGADGLRIYDVTNPADPRNIAHIDEGGQARCVAVQGNYAYLANLDDGLRIYDISNPASPVPVGHIDDGGTANGVAVSGNYIYLANGDDGLRIYSFSSPP